MFDATDFTSATEARTASMIKVAPAFDDLGDEIAELAGHLYAGTARLLDLVGEFDSREAFNHFGMASTAHWLAWRCGTAPRTAREQVRVARSLRQLPLVAAEFRRGALSYAKIRAVTRFAIPETQAVLLEWAATATAAQLERVARGVAIAKAYENPALLQKKRSLTVSTDADGMIDIHLKLPPDQAPVWLQAIELATKLLEGSGSAEPPAVVSESGSAEPQADTDAEWDPYDFEAAPLKARLAADAMTYIAETFLSNNGIASGDPDRALLLIQVDEDIMRARLPDGTVPPLETLLRLACDAAIARTDPGNLSIGRRSRTPSRAMRRALKRRDMGCRFPGCNATHRLDAHHIRHWARGGPTELYNLVLLCKRHHMLVHEGGFAVERMGGAEFRFFRPDGTVLKPAPTAGSAAKLTGINAEHAITPRTCETNWDGRHPDYGLSVSCILETETRLAAAGTGS